MSEVGQKLKRNSGSLTIMLIIVGGIVLAALTMSIAWRMPISYFFILIMLSGYGGLALWWTGVRFYSPILVSESSNVTFSMFEGRALSACVSRFGHHVGLAIVGGANAGKRGFSSPDYVEDSRGVQPIVIVTMSPFMLERFGRFLVVRGAPLKMSRAEKQTMLSIPEIREVLDRDGIRGAREMYVAYTSRTLKPDALPTDKVNLGEFGDLLGAWTSDIGISTEKFAETFKRKLKMVRSFKEADRLKPQPIDIADEDEKRRRRREQEDR